MIVELGLRLTELPGEQEARRDLEVLSAALPDVAALAERHPDLAVVVARAVAAGRLLDVDARAQFVTEATAQRREICRAAVLSVVILCVVIGVNALVLSGPRPLVPVLLGVLGLGVVCGVGYFATWRYRYAPGLLCGVYLMPRPPERRPRVRRWSRAVRRRAERR